MNTIICKRCGRCCHFIVDGVKKKCKYLVKLKEGRTYCKIYNNRKRAILSVNSDGSYTTCNNRNELAVNFKDCHYNRPEYVECGPEIYKKEFAIINKKILDKIKEKEMIKNELNKNSI